MKKRISMMDIYIFIVLLIFYITDAVYVYTMYKMHLQLSDFWIAANMIIVLVEIICCMIIKITKENDNTSKSDMKSMLNILVQIIAAITSASGVDISNIFNSSCEESSDEDDEYIDEEECEE